jgi:hypothetical protein
MNPERREKKVRGEDIFYADGGGGAVSCAIKSMAFISGSGAGAGATLISIKLDASPL